MMINMSQRIDGRRGVLTSEFIKVLEHLRQFFTYHCLELVRGRLDVCTVDAVT